MDTTTSAKKRQTKKREREREREREKERNEDKTKIKQATEKGREMENDGKSMKMTAKKNPPKKGTQSKQKRRHSSRMISLLRRNGTAIKKTIKRNQTLH